MEERTTIFEELSSKNNNWNYYEHQGIKYMYKDIDWLINELTRLKNLGFTCVNYDLFGFRFLSKEEEIQNKIKLEYEKHNRIISELNEELEQFTKYKI